MDSLTRWTGISALVVSSFSLGMSGWVVGCHGKSTPAPSDSPAAATTESPRTVAVRTAVPIASVAASAQPAAPAVEATTEKPSRPKPAARPAAAAAKDGSLRVKRLVLTRKVEAREPVEPSTTFAADEAPLYAFVELENKTADDAQIVVTFEKPGTRAGHIELGVPANQARWRTWGMSRAVRDAGEWVVVVRTSDGAELARAPFEVTRGT